MKTFFGFILLLLFSVEISAQTTSTNGGRGYDYFLRKSQIRDNGDSKIVVNKNNGDTTFQAYYIAKDVVSNTHQEFTKTYKGTPFFKNGWYKGRVKTQNEQGIEFLMAYNVQKNEVYVVEDIKKDAIVLKPESFTIAGHHFSKFNNAYYEVIYISKNPVLKEHVCVLTGKATTEKTGYEVSGGVGEYEGEFVKSAKYFILKEDEPIQLPRNRNLLNLFGEKKPLVEQYVKANNVNLKSENGIINTFKYFDSLENPQ